MNFQELTGKTVRITNLATGAVRIFKFGRKQYANRPTIETLYSAAGQVRHLQFADIVDGRAVAWDRTRVADAGKLANFLNNIQNFIGRVEVEILGDCNLDASVYTAEV